MKAGGETVPEVPVVLSPHKHTQVHLQEHIPEFKAAHEVESTAERLYDNVYIPFASFSFISLP